MNADETLDRLIEAGELLEAGEPREFVEKQLGLNFDAVLAIYGADFSDEQVASLVTGMRIGWLLGRLQFEVPDTPPPA